MEYQNLTCLFLIPIVNIAQVHSRIQTSNDLTDLAATNTVLLIKFIYICHKCEDTVLIICCILGNVKIGIYH